MRIYNLSDSVSIECEGIGTRSGFKHVAKAYRDGELIEEHKCCYINRTWERFPFQSVLSNFKYSYVLKFSELQELNKIIN